MKTKLLAPNGKPSNLTAEQYKLVRTPEFKKWFGDWEDKPNDNMLVDENGEPLILWHTGGNWTKLDVTRGSGLMFAFTKDTPAYSAKEKITRPFFIKSDFIYIVKYEQRDSPKKYLKPTKHKNPVYFVQAYGGFIIVHNPTQIKLADGTNTKFDYKNNDIRFEKGGIADSGTPDYLKFLIG